MCEVPGLETHPNITSKLPKLQVARLRHVANGGT